MQEVLEERTRIRVSWGGGCGKRQLEVDRAKIQVKRIQVQLEAEKESGVGGR